MRYKGPSQILGRIQDKLNENCPIYCPRCFLFYSKPTQRINLSVWVNTKDRFDEIRIDSDRKEYFDIIINELSK